MSATTGPLYAFSPTTAAGTDITSLLTAEMAINPCPLIPPGNWTMDPIVMQLSGQIIRGCGDGITVITANPISSGSEGASTPLVSVVGQNHFGLADLTLDMNNNMGCAFLATGGTEVLLDRCGFQNGQQTLVGFQQNVATGGGGTNYGRIDHCRFLNSGNHGIELSECTGIHIVAPRMSGISWAGINMAGSSDCHHYGGHIYGTNDKSGYGGVRMTDTAFGCSTGHWTGRNNSRGIYMLGCLNCTASAVSIFYPVFHGVLVQSTPIGPGATTVNNSLSSVTVHDPWCGGTEGGYNNQSGPQYAFEFNQQAGTTCARNTFSGCTSVDDRAPVFVMNSYQDGTGGRNTIGVDCTGYPI